MANFNQVMLMGRAYNVKPKVTKNGKSMTTFTITTYKRLKDKDDKPLFHSCVAYSGLADVIGKYVNDGREILVTGELDYYKDQNDVHRTQVVVESMEFSDGGDKGVRHE